MARSWLRAHHAQVDASEAIPHPEIGFASALHFGIFFPLELIQSLLELRDGAATVQL